MTVSARSSWELHVAVGDAPAVVRVSNLQTTVRGPHDAWGRPGRPQPLLVSASVSLRRPFSSTSSRDALAPDTVHYGRLSKVILASLAECPACSLLELLMWVWVDLTGADLSGEPRDSRGEPFLDASVARGLQLTALLPKASLLGDGASLTLTGVFGGDDPSASPVSMYGQTLSLHNLRVPTLIGINENEREAKQAVVVNVEVDNHGGTADTFSTLEAKIVARMADSSFGTLEALAAHVAETVTMCLRMQQPEALDGPGSHLKITVEKPMAVPLADAPCVELRTNTRDVTVPTTSV